MRIILITLFCLAVYGKLCGENPFVAQIENDFIKVINDTEVNKIWDTYQQSNATNVTNADDFFHCKDLYKGEAKSCCPQALLTDLKIILKKYFKVKADNENKKPFCVQATKTVVSSLKKCGLRPNSTLLSGSSSSASSFSSTSSFASATSNSSFTFNSSASSGNSSMAFNSSVSSSNSSSSTSNSSIAINNNGTQASDDKTSSRRQDQASTANVASQGGLVVATIQKMRGLLCMLCQNPDSLTAPVVFANGSCQINKQSSLNFKNEKLQFLLDLKNSHETCRQSLDNFIVEEGDPVKCGKLRNDTAAKFQLKDPCPNSADCKSTLEASVSTCFSNSLDDSGATSTTEVPTRRNMAVSDVKEVDNGGVSSYTTSPDDLELTINGTLLTAIQTQVSNDNQNNTTNPVTVTASTSSSFRFTLSLVAILISALLII